DGPTTTIYSRETDIREGDGAVGALGGHGPPGGTLPGLPRISAPLPPRVRASSRPNHGDRDHQRTWPTPVTPWQPETWIPTGGKPRVPATNISRNAPKKAAGQCRPRGIGGSAQSAAARARTLGAFLIMIPPGSTSWEPPAGRAGVRMAAIALIRWAAAQS